MSKPHLVSFDLCPYVQRSVITLEEKGVDYDITYIDLADKPAWFQEISPLGKVPVLRIGDTTLFESDVIAEYLDEVHGPRLHPEDALERAIHRSWMAYCSGVGGPAYQLMVAQTEDRARAATEATRTLFARVEDKIVGPFFSGADFRLIDACSASFLQRVLWIDARAPQLGLFDGYPKVRAWADALVARPSVRASLKPDILDIFDAYLRDHGAWVAAQGA